MRRYIFLTVLCALFAGCCTCKPVAVSNDRDSTATHTELHTDTFIERDSVFVSVREKGDTVWMERLQYKYVYKYRDVAVHDTVMQAVTETVEVPVEVVREVPRCLPWWEKAEAWGFWLLLAAWGWHYRAKIAAITRRLWG